MPLIDITMGMEKLVADFTLNAHDRDVLSLFGERRQSNFIYST